MYVQYCIAHTVQRTAYWMYSDVLLCTRPESEPTVFAYKATKMVTFTTVSVESDIGVIWTMTRHCTHTVSKISCTQDTPQLESCSPFNSKDYLYDWNTIRRNESRSHRKSRGQVCQKGLCLSSWKEKANLIWHNHKHFLCNHHCMYRPQLKQKSTGKTQGKMSALRSGELKIVGTTRTIPSLESTRGL